MYKRNKAIQLVILSLILVLLLMVYIEADAEKALPNGSKYINEDLGFSMTIPKSWQSRYEIVEDESSISFINTKNKDEYGGHLFTIERLLGEAIYEEDIEQSPLLTKLLLQGNGYSYIGKFPSDVQYDNTNPRFTKDYMDMYEEVGGILDTINLYGKNKPLTEIKNFKFAGSIFFSLEIPLDWSIQRNNINDLQWDINYKDYTMGNISLVTLKEANEESSDGLTYYLTDENIGRSIKLYLDKYIDRDIKTKVKNTLKINPSGGANIMDYKNTYDEYLSRGADELFGQIKSIELDDNRIASGIIIREMKLIVDEKTNKLRVDDLGREVELKLNYERIIPLVKPAFKDYSIYEMPLLGETFIEDYPNYKDSYYEFIVRDGSIKGIIEKYMPQ